MATCLVLGITTADAAAFPPVQSVIQDLEGSAARFVNRELAQVTALYFACVGIYVFLSFLFLIYWRWLRRDLTMLAVGLLSIVMVVHTAAISGSLPFILPSLVDTSLGMTLETVSYLLLNGFIAFMLWAFFPESFRPREPNWIGTLNAVVAGGAVLASAVFAVMAVAPGGDDAAILAISRWLTVLLMIVVAALAFQAFESRRLYARITAVGFCILVVGSIHDVLFAGIGSAGRPYLITFAILAFVLLKSYVVLRRAAESTHVARLSTRRLRREVEARTKELRAASVAAQAANMAKTEFVTAVTHELRTPLASLIGYVDLIREEATDGLNPEQLEFFGSLELSAERLLNLVNNLLDLARIESGRIEVTIGHVDLEQLVGEVRRRLFPMANEKNLYVRTEIDATHRCIQSDDQWLSVVVSNLVSNAVKYTENGGITIRVEDAKQGARDAVCIRIQDTGLGISSEFMPRLFHRFSREETARENAPSGSGLGLTIVRELLDHLGGEITVESRTGSGSTFSVLLPVDGPTDAS